ncbi:MAG: PmoA family protein [Verrucomicrobiales bacterium]|nr:PmoA family protein [Verrucomicrobiales bacterium]
MNQDETALLQRDRAHIDGNVAPKGGARRAATRHWVSGGSWVFLLAMFLIAGWRGFGAEPGHALDPSETITGAMDPSLGRAQLTFRGRPLMTYVFAGEQFKPYVQALHTLRGENVIRDAPSDHLHHHGLMYAIRVNGANFWEERAPAGRQIALGPPTLTVARTDTGLPSAWLVQELDWQTSDGSGPAVTLLHERREIRLTVNPGVEEVALEWRSQFEVDRGVERAVLHGADYHGLGIRFPEEFDKVAEFQNSEGVPYSEAQTWDVRPAAWTAVSGRVSGREAMLVLAGHPSNAGVGSFFSMRNAFAYLTATQSLGRQPISYQRGAKFDVRYLVLVYPAAQNRAYLTGRLAPWLKGR